MSQGRIPVPPRSVPTVVAGSPLGHASTISFLASWKGQLLTCTVFLVFGAVYFLLQEPISAYRRRKKEALSRAKYDELMSMEGSPGERAGTMDDAKERRGRDKRKDVRRRKGSWLKVPTAGSGDSSATGVSSAEASPNPLSNFSVPSPKPSSTPSKGKARAVSVTQQSQTSSIAVSVQPPPSTLAPPSLVVRSVTPSPPSTIPPWNIPLPESPIAGSSRLTASLPDTDLESNDGDGGNTSESALSIHVNGDANEASVKPIYNGFSIIPEEGYLPEGTAIPNGKKKKRKGRAPPPQPLADMDRRASRSGSVNEGLPPTPGRASLPNSPIAPTTPATSRHARKASLIRPIGADLEDLLTDRERMIDALRADIGVAKAEEAKAREQVVKAKVVEDRLVGDLERIQNLNLRAETEIRKRENEFTVRLGQLSSHYTATLHRVAALEQVLRDIGHAIPPPPSPGIPIQQMQGAPSPVPPMSPYGVDFGPSPRNPGIGFVPYPGPSMYSTPMLHPHYHGASHSHSPSPFRRTSPSGLRDDAQAAGLLPPGQPAAVNGAFTSDLGIMPLGSPASVQQPTSTANGGLSPADLRRLSIESSVLKKKPQHPTSDSGDSSPRAESDPLPDIDEVSSKGLGVGELSIVEEAFTDPMGGQELSDGGSREGRGDNNSTDSHPSSPSPPNRASMLLTPASPDLFHCALSINGSQTPEIAFLSSGGGSRCDLSVPLQSIEVMHDGEKGNVYYHSAPASEIGEGGSDGVSALDTDMSTRSAAYREKSTENGSDENGDSKVEYTPMFASLAHTPQQLVEIQRMREDALRAREKGRMESEDRGRSRQVRSGSLHGVEERRLSPSPSKISMTVAPDQ